LPFIQVTLTFLTYGPVSHFHLLFHLTPEIVIHNSITSSLLLFELTCPLDGAHHLDLINKLKMNITKSYRELDHLNANFYETLEVSVLGHYHQFSATNIYNVLLFIDKSIPITKSLVRQMLDDASRVCITASQRIFMARRVAVFYLTLCNCNFAMCMSVVVFVCSCIFSSFPCPHWYHFDKCGHM